MKSTMPFSSINFKMYNFMERKKPRGKNIDEFAIMKAAAWAWYQRGSGSEGKPMREYDFSNSHRTPKPSRYKLEAMKKSMKKSTEGSVEESLLASSISISPSHSNDNFSLLDTYEIDRISKELEYYIDIESKYGKFIDRDRGHHRRVLALSEGESSGVIGKEKKNKKVKGFWSRHAAVCGTTDDVVVNNIRAFRGGRQPEKVVNRRPRAAHA